MYREVDIRIELSNSAVLMWNSLGKGQIKLLKSMISLTVEVAMVCFYYFLLFLGLFVYFIYFTASTRRYSK